MWSLCNVSIYTGAALQWCMTQTLLCQQACGGHSSTFAIIPPSLFPPSSLLPQLSIFCHPFVLQLFHSPVFLCLSWTSVLSLSFSLTPSFELFLLLFPSFTNAGHPFSSLSSLCLFSHSFFGACLPFCCGFLMDFENCSASSPIQSTWNKIYTHWQQITKDISSLTFFLL